MIDAHRGAFEYDWRARFSLPLTVVGRSMSWGEASRITQRLVCDPTSEVCAALSGWTHTADRAALVLMDLYDAFAQVNFKKPKPYPRPWPDRTSVRTKPTLSQAEIVAALRAAGHTKALPVST